MSTATQKPGTEPSIELWTLGEVCQFLRITDSTARTWIRSGKIPPSAIRRPGYKFLFDAHAIKAMTETN